MTGNNAVYDNLASIYPAIQQYAPYGDNSFLTAMTLTIVFTISMAYLGLTTNDTKIQSLFPSSNSNSSISQPNSMPPPLQLIKSLLLSMYLPAISFASYTLFTSLFVIDWSKNELVDSTFIDPRVDLFIRVLLSEIFVLSECIAALYICLVVTFYWTPERLEHPPKFLCTFANRVNSAKKAVLLAMFAHFLLLIDTLYFTF